ncbi:hypothetical protein SLEP1_g19072 [Rubroshorea leprosula]|nr:hypothetical protein SLEP1_g19072 [Rubroshorea leprosula]
MKESLRLVDLAQKEDREMGIETHKPRYTSTITCEKFEELCEDLWEKSLTPVKEVLKYSGLEVDDIYAVELIGGATRVPKLQVKLQESLGKKELHKHLDADEAIVLGAALHAASDGIKLNRKLGMTDGSSYGFFVELDGPDLLKNDSNKQLLVPRMKKLPSKMFRTIAHDKDFGVSLAYESGDLLPPGLLSPVFAQCVVSGLAEASEKYASHNLSAPIKTNLHFSLSRSGIISLDRVDSVIEISEWVEVPRKNISAENATVASSNISAEVGAEKVSEENKEGLNSDSVVSSASNTNTNTNTNTTVEEPSTVDLGTENLECLCQKSLLLKPKLESEEFEKMSSVDERQSFMEKLDEVQEWLYTDGEEATATEFQERLNSLTDIGDPIVFWPRVLLSQMNGNGSSLTRL